MVRERLGLADGPCRDRTYDLGIKSRQEGATRTDGAPCDAASGAGSAGPAGAGGVGGVAALSAALPARRPRRMQPTEADHVWAWATWFAPANDRAVQAVLSHDAWLTTDQVAAACHQPKAGVVKALCRLEARGLVTHGLPDCVPSWRLLAEVPA